MIKKVEASFSTGKEIINLDKTRMYGQQVDIVLKYICSCLCCLKREYFEGNKGVLIIITAKNIWVHLTR